MYTQLLDPQAEMHPARDDLMLPPQIISELLNYNLAKFNLLQVLNFTQTKHVYLRDRKIS